MNRLLLLPIALMLVFGVACTPPAWSADDQKPEGSKIEVAQSFRVSTLTGMPVYNRDGKHIGKIEELVVNLEKGKIEYAALSFGGVLGLGDKLFAVPFSKLTLKYDETTPYFSLDVSKEALEKAPGFNKGAWPDVASSNWARELEEYYGETAHSGKVVATTDGQLTMTDMLGGNSHAHAVGKDTPVTLNGEPAKLSDLKAGFTVSVTTERHNGKMIATRIDAKSRR